LGREVNVDEAKDTAVAKVEECTVDGWTKCESGVYEEVVNGDGDIGLGEVPGQWEEGRN